MLEQQAAVDRVFQALGEPARRAMVDRLSKGPATVSELAAPFAMTLAAVVQHVQVLELSGVITTQKVGRVRTCELAPEGLALAERWIAQRRQVWERRLDRLGALLDEDEEPSPPRPTTTTSRPRAKKKKGKR